MSETFTFRDGTEVDREGFQSRACGIFNHVSIANALERYCFDRIRPGGTLSLCLSGASAVEVWGVLDDSARRQMGDIMEFIAMELPECAQGSKKNIAAWLKDKK